MGQRLGWFFAAFFLGLISQLLDPVSPVIPLVGWALFPVGLGVAMVRYGLFDGDRLLSRTLVSIVLAGAVAGVFGFAVGLGSNWLGGEGAGAVAAAVVIALGLSPARRLVQRGVDRVLYGQPRDPYTVLTRLGRRLSATIAPDEVLPVVVEAVADALRLPYAAVTLAGEAQPAAARGIAPPVTVDLPLLHAGTVVGTLVVGPPGGRSFLQLVAGGLTTADIACRLRLSEKTVRNHTSNVVAKLRVEDRAQAIVRARQAGLGQADKPT